MAFFRVEMTALSSNLKSLMKYYANIWQQESEID